jgi:hypothetical protein
VKFWRKEAAMGMDEARRLAKLERECARLNAHCEAVGDLCSSMAALLLATGTLVLGIGFWFTAPDALASAMTMLLMAFVLTMVWRSSLVGDTLPAEAFAPATSRQDLSRADRTEA